MSKLVACLLSASLLAACGEDKEPRTKTFKAGFEWGSATAAYQVEGGNTQADFYLWEQRCEPGDEVGERDSSETFIDCQSNLDGPNFWEKYESDWDQAVAMGHNSARLGIEWAKIEPTQGTYDPAVLAHYHAILDAARARGLDLMVTLQHFTLPAWANDIDDPNLGLGGWGGSDTTPAGQAPIIAEFVRFAGDMGEEFGEDVDLWVTINEPMVILPACYLAGLLPPARSLEVGRTLRALYNMAYAHAGAYDALHARDLGDADGDGDTALVSVAHHWRIFDPFDPSSPLDVEAAARFDEVFNRFFIDVLTSGKVDLNADGDLDDPGEGVDVALADRLDWLGLNYYGRKLAKAPLVTFDDILVPFYFVENEDPERPHNDMGWEVYPQGMERMLAEARGWGLPIRITENGMADADDAERPGFIVSHLKALAHAMRDGADVRGYYHWTLMDNFEWLDGYGPRFGLLQVDFDDPARTRTRTRGADAMQAIIEAGEVTSAIEESFGTLGE